MECPSCFILGAELVREGNSNNGKKKVVRQACFRFPQHHAQCDFSRSDLAGTAVPDNLVDFRSAKAGLTRLIAQLVGAGIEGGYFSQRTIREMRLWFFKQKIQSTFEVGLDPRVPVYLKQLMRFTAGYYGAPPVVMSAEIAKLPGINWLDAARSELRANNSTQLDAIHHSNIRLWITADRVAQLCNRHMGEAVFDPSPLQEEYTKTIQLADFISRNYSPVSRFRSAGDRKPHVPAMLAFCALVLYVAAWDLDRASNLFATIAIRAGEASADLGNVMGLNPWHDFQAWRDLRALQDLGLSVPDGAKDPEEQLKDVEASLRARYEGFAETR
jgi:hypothetical protein